MKKRDFKHAVTSCLLCGFIFTEYSQKNIHRINPLKGVAMFNTTVLCSECKYYLIKTNQELYDIFIPKEHVKTYFTAFSLGDKRKVFSNICRLRRINKNK